MLKSLQRKEGIYDVVAAKFSGCLTLDAPCVKWESSVWNESHVLQIVTSDTWSKEINCQGEWNTPSCSVWYEWTEMNWHQALWVWWSHNVWCRKWRTKKKICCIYNHKDLKSCNEMQFSLWTLNFYSILQNVYQYDIHAEDEIDYFYKTGTG